jgi:hypothetical protein
MKFSRSALRGLMAALLLISVGSCGGADKTNDNPPSVNVEMGAGSNNPSPSPDASKPGKPASDANEPVVTPPRPGRREWVGATGGWVTRLADLLASCDDG